MFWRKACCLNPQKKKIYADQSRKSRGKAMWSGGKGEERKRGSSVYLRTAAQVRSIIIQIRDKKEGVQEKKRGEDPKLE